MADVELRYDLHTASSVIYMYRHCTGLGCTDYWESIAYAGHPALVHAPEQR